MNTKTIALECPENRLQYADSAGGARAMTTCYIKSGTGGLSLMLLEPADHLRWSKLIDATSLDFKMDSHRFRA